MAQSALKERLQPGTSERDLHKPLVLAVVPSHEVRSLLNDG